jgi:hypothetical protein
MLDTLYNGIDQINASQKPIAQAWQLATQYLGINKKMEKIIEILGNHENLFISKNPYHNHYHLAEVIWLSALLVKEEVPEKSLYNHAVIILLAATFHDAEHPGRNNKEPFEIEQESALFFKKWWKNNSLFVENIVDMNPIDMEQAISELILFTEFTDGAKKVKEDYIKRRNREVYTLEYFMGLKKVLTEADILLNFLPLTAYKKCNLLLDEVAKSKSEKEKWQLILETVKSGAQTEFTSDSSDYLDLQHQMLKFTTFLEENSIHFTDGTMQSLVQRNFSFDFVE